MYTPLMKKNLKNLCKEPVMFDANILMVGIENSSSDQNCAFEYMTQLYLTPLLRSFSNVLIHEMVYNELDDERKKLVDSYDNVTIVNEGNLYGVDPQYTTIFNNISKHDRIKYDRRNTKDKGEVYSLAYAAFHKINFFCCKEIKIDYIAQEIEDLKHVEIITFDIIVLLAFIYHNNLDNKSYNRALKSIYKRYCEDVIKRHKLPGTLKEYFIMCQDYI